MKILSGKEAEREMRWIERAGREARLSACLRRNCGAIIVKRAEGREILIGQGFNSPAGNAPGARRCECDNDALDKRITDKTCCVHAEQRAIMDAVFRMAKYSQERSIKESLGNTTLYFASVDADGKILHSGNPYCTICSKFALDAGISFWCLEHKEGITIYGAEEYNRLSFEYRGENAEEK